MWSGVCISSALLLTGRCELLTIRVDCFSRPLISWSFAFRRRPEGSPMRLSDCAAGVRSRPPDKTDVPHDPESAPLFGALPTQAFHPSGPAFPIRRARLVRTLGTVAPEVPLVLLVAPPGYGKTTALRQWGA